MCGVGGIVVSTAAFQIASQGKHQADSKKHATEYVPGSHLNCPSRQKDKRQGGTLNGCPSQKELKQARWLKAVWCPNIQEKRQARTKKV